MRTQMICFFSFRLLKVDDIYKTQVGTYMFKKLHSLSPEPLILTCNYRRNRDVHSYNTRHAGDIHTPYARTQRAASKILRYAPSNWSSLPQGIRDCHSLCLCSLIINLFFKIWSWYWRLGFCVMNKLHKVTRLLFVLWNNYLALNKWFCFIYTFMYVFIWLPSPMCLDACLSYSDHWS